jgi:hypothetical protein
MVLILVMERMNRLSQSADSILGCIFPFSSCLGLRIENFILVNFYAIVILLRELAMSFQQFLIILEVQYFIF